MWDKRRSFNPRKRESFGGAPRRRGPSASNAVVNAIMECAAIHGQPAYRMQSRQFEVEGEEGKPRPFFIGAWADRFGTMHYGGMADVLVTPCILLPGPVCPQKVQLALWCEAKSGKGALTKHQRDFRDNVEATGGEWLECRDSADALLQWFLGHVLVRP